MLTPNPDFNRSTTQALVRRLVRSRAAAETLSINAWSAGLFASERDRTKLRAIEQAAESAKRLLDLVVAEAEHELFCHGDRT